MIQAMLWLWGLARALQRPLVGQPCPWCGRTDNATVGREEIAVAVGETLRELRRSQAPRSQTILEDTARRMGHALNRPDDPPAPAGVPS